MKKSKKGYKKKACERYQYGCERYKNLSEDEKQKLEYRNEILWK